MELTQKVKYMIPIAGGAILLLILSCFMGLTIKQDEMIYENIHLSAKRLFDSIVITRRWNASYGGVYVQKKKGMESNPYLTHPDIISDSGIVYTLKNPALMTRELSEIAARWADYRYHITSLKLMNPKNSPDRWEHDSLEKFEQGVKETTQLIDIKGEKVFRLMRPIFFEESCSGCHLHQGYKIGDVRGGISVDLPYDQIAKDLAANRFKMLGLALSIGFVFFSVFYFVIWKLVCEMSYLTTELAFQKNKLEDLNSELDKKVLDRTAELKASEERFRTTFENAGVGICHTSTDGRLLRFNKQFCRITGYTTDELYRLKFEDISHPQDIEENLSQLQRLLSGESESFTIEKRYFRKDMSAIWVSVTVSLVKTISNEPDYFIAVVEDISERRRLEAQLQQARKMEAIGTLAGGVAHDFNNILTPIIGYTEILLGEMESGRREKFFLQEIFGAARRAQDLVKQILTFSRRTECEKTVFNMALIIKESLKLLRATIPSTIEFRQDIDSDDCIVKADPTQIHQIIMNLCTNAFHAMGDNGGVLTVFLKIEEISGQDTSLEVSSGRYVLLEVGDSGCGMNAETIERIYEPYFSTKPKGEGTGLGLAMVHGIVKSLGGYISVYSEPGDGTVFRIYIPVHESNSIPENRKKVSGEIPGGSERIMVVDDDAIITSMITTMLSGLGYKVIAENSSTEALSRFQSDPGAFDLVITDMTMPKLTGIMLAQQLLALRPQIPIILCTGFSLQINAENARAVGIRAFLTKPVLKKDLALAVRQALDGN